MSLSREILNYLRASLCPSDHPVGTQLRCCPERHDFVVNAAGGGSVDINLGGRPALDYTLEIDRLPPNRLFSIRFISICHPDPSDYVWRKDEEPALTYILGEFQHEYYNQTINRRFLVILDYDPESRKISSRSCEEYNLKKARKMIFFKLETLESLVK